MKHMLLLLLITTFISCSKEEPTNTNANQSIVESISDVDGNIYNGIKIGDQVWLGSNLKTSKYNDGTPITELAGNEEWDDADDNWSSARCIYDNDYSLKSTHGFLYNFWAVSATYNGNKNICPIGYKIPSIEDWGKLSLFLDPNGTGGNNIAGGALKVTGTNYWRDPNADATNETGFSAIPSGDRSGSSGSFDDLDRKANFWSSSSELPDSGGGRAYWVSLSFGNGELLFPVPKTKGMGFNCRCIKN